MEIKLPSSGLLLIVLSLWRLIQLSTVKFAYSAFNTLSLKFSPRTRLALFTATTLAIPGLRIRLSMVLLLQEDISGLPFLCYSESSRCTLPRWWKNGSSDEMFLNGGSELFMITPSDANYQRVIGAGAIASCLTCELRPIIEALDLYEILPILEKLNGIVILYDSKADLQAIIN
ncbi:hypothetical protein TNCV_3414281 [Trichonephila clavipes]|uniref:Uncharacterized protein n=1 Tax=Trichonephila clavipes TaxID=2585209 RepID=A0A8X6UV97_TRICX|nr:hypothetical protein TNCV_3414281 [Trichonephila clavipes]